MYSGTYSEYSRSVSGNPTQACYRRADDVVRSPADPPEADTELDLNGDKRTPPGILLPMNRDVPPATGLGSDDMVKLIECL